MVQLILLRHGESQWNLENRFTGWKDVSLTKKGIAEAEFSGKQLIKANITVNSVYTSILNRATETTDMVTRIINFPQKKIQYDWRLNERHYGALQGLNKSETAERYGEKQVQIWRRSYDTSPPKLNLNDKRHPRFNKKFAKISSKLPCGESLHDVIIRLGPFWNEYKKIIFQNDDRAHLIVAHSNSLRAIVKMLDNLTKEEIIEVNIPTGVPLIYCFNNQKKIIEKRYLISDKDLKKKQEMIKGQGKAK